MSNFKSGSGNLDFGSNEDDIAKEEKTAKTTDNHTEPAEEPLLTPSDANSRTEASSGAVTASQNSETVPSPPSSIEYPYFVRRSKVGDERDTRLEIHVRDKVTEQEAEFRSELAKRLGVNEISKTDAREFALLAAFQDPERVANRMREEGFGILD